MHFMKTLPGLILAGLMFSSSAMASDIPELGIRDFFKPNEFSNVVMSPDGTHIAALARLPASPGATNIVVMNVDTRDTKVVTGYKDQEDVAWVNWVDNDRVIFTLSKYSDEAEDRARFAGMFVIGKDGKRGRSLQKRDKRSALNASARESEATPNLLSLVMSDPEHILVTMNDKRYIYQDVFRMKLSNGHMTKVQVNFGNVLEWVPDHDGVVRIAVDQGDDLYDNINEIKYRATENDEWKKVGEVDADSFTIHGFSQDNKTLFVSDRTKSDKFQFYQMNPATFDLGEPIVTDPVYDVDGNLFEKDDAPVYLRYLSDKVETVFFNDEWQQRQLSIDAALPDNDNRVTPVDDNDERFLVYSRSSINPGRYYMYDEKTKKLTFLMARRDWVNPEQMAVMQPVSFKARDGETLHGYLTMPRGKEKSKVPMIIHPHGGPYGIRDRWQFNPEIQFLANRGYGVLQINYRGSGGYGKRFETMAYKQWGLEMQDDLTDGAEWIRKQGLVDGDRLGIYGASYGGYATMAGVTKTPDLFKAGINYVGVVDMMRLIRDGRKSYNVSGRQEFMESFFLRAVGDWNDPTDVKRLEQTSPINHVDKIKAPLLVIHGRLDDRVDIYQYEMLISKLKAHKKDFKGIMRRHEGHGFYAEENNVDLYTEIENFLAENL